MLHEGNAFPDLLAEPPKIRTEVGDRKSASDFATKTFAPQSKTPHFGPPERTFVPHFLERPKKGTHKLLGGESWGKKILGVPKRAILGCKMFSLLLFIALNEMRATACLCEQGNKRNAPLLSATPQKRDTGLQNEMGSR